MDFSSIFYWGASAPPIRLFGVTVQLWTLFFRRGVVWGVGLLRVGGLHVALLSAQEVSCDEKAKDWRLRCSLLGLWLTSTPDAWLLRWRS